MAIRFDATTTKGLVRTTGAPATLGNVTWTMMAWVNFTAFPTNNNYYVLFGITTNATSRYDMLYIKTTNPNTRLNIQTDNGSYAETVATTNLSTGTWYHMTIARESNTLLRGYLNGVSDGTQAQNQTGTGTPRIEAGRMAAFSDTLNARMAGYKYWDAALTAAEVINEMQTLAPRRYANLNTWCPMFPGSGERARDYSGNNRDFTESGTLTDEDPPPVSFGGASKTHVFISAAATPKSLPMVRPPYRFTRRLY